MATRWTRLAATILAATCALLAAWPAGAGAETKIVGGSQVSIDDHPWQVFLLISVGSDLFDCGGSLRDASHVVTAAHCVLDDRGDYPAILGGGDVTVGYGSANLDTLSWVDVSAITVDPRYDRNRESNAYDDAVLTLASPISFGASGAAPQPVQYATDQELDAAFGSGGFVTGWGTTLEGGDPPADHNLRGAAVPLQSDDACTAEYGSSYVAAVMICAGGTGTDTCQGDSGGPLTVDTDPTGGVSRKLVGITSGGNGCGRTGVPGYYTWVQSPDILQVIANPDPVAAPAGPPAANPGVSGVLRVGRPVTCNAPSLPGASATQYFWYRHTQAAGYTRIGQGRTITLTTSSLGARIQCDVRYEGAGGFVYKETPLGAYVGPVRPRPTTLHVYGPPHPLVGKNYAVGANGWTAKRRVLQVTIHRHGQCKPTYGADKRSGSFVVFARFVGPGDYNQTRGKLHFTQRTQGHYCAYLGNPNDSQSHPPVARASQQFAVAGG